MPLLLPRYSGSNELEIWLAETKQAVWSENKRSCFGPRSNSRTLEVYVVSRVMFLGTLLVARLTEPPCPSHSWFVQPKNTDM